MSQPAGIRLRVPKQDLEGSSFFACDEAAVANWTSALPLTNIGQATRQLYQALTELNRVRLMPERRLALLDLLRTPIHFVSRGLTRHYLNQPLALPEQAAKIAEINHALHQRLAIGYTVVATHTAALGDRAGTARPDDIIATALHRAITEHSLNMLQQYELYQAVDAGVWHTLHQFFDLATQHKLLGRKVLDSEYGLCTVGEAYIRALLLGCANPNQLRQDDLVELFPLLTRWAGSCRLDSASAGHGLFVIDPSGDNHPLYRALVESVLEPWWIALDTQALVTHLDQLAASDSSSFRLKDGDHPLSRDLLNHLRNTWHSMCQRLHMRMESQQQLELCVGLSACHHFLANELPFEALVAESGARTFTMQFENPFLKAQTHIKREKDVWDSPYAANVGQTDIPYESIRHQMQTTEQKAVTQTSDKKYQFHSVQAVNCSAHGYCIAWPDELTVPIKAGEIVGMREPLSHNWSIASVRWLHRDADGTHIGLELLSPAGTPCGARIVQKTGSPGDYMRVLILPAMTVVQRPVTLLTPRIPFREGQKVTLNQRGHIVQVQLGKRLNATGAYNLFEFRRLGAVDSSSDTPQAALDEFEALWGHL